MSNRHRIWITYAWLDDDEGDFSYLVQELAQCGVEARFDKIALVRGQRLWEQIAREIIEGDYAAWAYLLTPNSVGSEACREELAYALYRALNEKGADFPLIGLLHQVEIADVPAPLRVRLCIDMRNPHWCEEVRSAAERRPPELPEGTTPRFAWTLSDGRSGGIRVEVRPRFGDLMYWRFVIPSGAEVVEWGHGPVGGGGLSGSKTNVVEGGSGEMNGQPVTWFGSGDRLSPGVSASVELRSRPSFVAFGLATDPFGPPGEVETISL